MAAQDIKACRLQSHPVSLAFGTGESGVRYSPPEPALCAGPQGRITKE